MNLKNLFSILILLLIGTVLLREKLSSNRRGLEVVNSFIQQELINKPPFMCNFISEESSNYLQTAYCLKFHPYSVNQLNKIEKINSKGSRSDLFIPLLAEQYWNYQEYPRINKILRNTRAKKLLTDYAQRAYDEKNWQVLELFLVTLNDMQDAPGYISRSQASSLLFQLGYHTEMAGNYIGAEIYYRWSINWNPVILADPFLGLARMKIIEENDYPGAIMILLDPLKNANIPITKFLLTRQIARYYETIQEIELAYCYYIDANDYYKSLDNSYITQDWGIELANKIELIQGQNPTSQCR